MYTRRQFGKLALAAAPLPVLASKIDSKIHGVQIGLHTWSFSTLPLDGILDIIIRSMVDTGIGECILLAQHIEPRELWDQVRPAPGAAISPEAQTRARQKLAEWRLSVSLDHFQAVCERFANAGIEICGFGASPSPDASDQELDRTFEIARTLGAKIVVLGGTISQLRRLAPFAEKHRMMIGLQGRPDRHSTDPNQISRPEDYDKALAISKSLWLSLDIGDATGAGFDAFEFVRDHRERMSCVYLKDRRRDRTSVPWGEGDTPIRQILQWIRDGRYPIRGFIDCDYKSTGDRPADVKRCFAYAKTALS